MPCENCNTEFNVFRRKRFCFECGRSFCNHCVVKRSDRFFCEHCVIFIRRPLLKADLLELRPKDLIFYLQLKHVPIAGCVEKEELIELILLHCAQQNTPKDDNNLFYSYRQQSNGSQHFGSTFSQIKQSCQHFFLNFSEKVSNDLNVNVNISKSDSAQGNVRKMPPYSTCNGSQKLTTQNQQHNIAVQSSPTAVSNLDSSAHSFQNISESNECLSNGRNCVASSGQSSKMDNSVATINSQSMEKADDVDSFKISLLESEKTYKFEPTFELPGPSGYVSPSLHILSSPSSSKSVREEQSNLSNDELRAVGGNNDNICQFVTKSKIDYESNEFVEHTFLGCTDINDFTNFGSLMSKTPCDKSFDQIIPKLPVVGERLLSRHHSDSALYSRFRVPTINFLLNVQNGDNNASEKPIFLTNLKKCFRCRRKKAQLREYVSKIKQLNYTRVPDEDLKQEIDALVYYIETLCSESADCFRSEPAIEDVNIRKGGIDVFISKNSSTTQKYNMDTENSTENLNKINKNENTCSSLNLTRKSRFVNLNKFSSRSELEELSVKQLKEILMRNRVDYRGCCEKRELLDRVDRLRKEFQIKRRTDKSTVDDLCKICMDAPIECIILECGHMASCTNCGKVLSECPICRQYIVRVVRFFRA